MKIPSFFRRCALLTGLLLAAPTFNLSRAADATTNAAAETLTPSAGRFTLEIHDGNIIVDGKPAGAATVGNILSYLKKQNHDFSLVLGPGVADVHVGEMILQMEHFDLPAICESIASCAEAPLTAQLEDGTNVCVLSLVGRKRDVAVFNLSSYLPVAQTGEKTPEQKVALLRDIIENAYAGAYPFVSPGDQPMFQFHAGANLLVVTGTEDAIDIANKVINAVIHPDVYAGNDNTNPFASNAAPQMSNVPFSVYWYWANTPSQTASADRYALYEAQLQALLSGLERGQAQLAQGASPQTQATLKELQKYLDELKQMSPGNSGDPAAAAAAISSWAQALPRDANGNPKTPPPAGSGPAFSAPVGTAR